MTRILLAGLVVSSLLAQEPTDAPKEVPPVAISLCNRFPGGLVLVFDANGGVKLRPGADVAAELEASIKALAENFEIHINKDGMTTMKRRRPAVAPATPR